MKLYIMRHGQAEMYAPSDAERPLSDYGREEVRRSAQSLKGISFDGIISSPYLRARQTAEIVASVVGVHELTIDDRFTPDDGPATALSGLPEQGCWLLVSHMPLVSRLTGLLVDGSEAAGPGFVTAMVAELETDYPASGMAFLKNIYTP